MVTEPEVGVSEQESVFRSKYYHDIRAVRQRELCCASCGNVVGCEVGQVFSHSKFGILQCRECKEHFESIAFDSDNSESPCCICGKEHRNYHKCSHKKCSYKFCETCIKRNVPQSLGDAETKKWKCFVCNPKPLWKLRGACAAVMSSIPKRTKTKKVSRNKSSDREGTGSDLKNISYVKRCRQSESEKLNKRLQSICDEESPRPQPTLFSRNYATSQPISAAPSSDDSDIQEIIVPTWKKKQLKKKLEEHNSVVTGKNQSTIETKDSRKKTIFDKGGSRDMKNKKGNVASMSLRKTSSSDSSDDNSDIEDLKRLMPSIFGKKNADDRKKMSETKCKVVKIDSSNDASEDNKEQRSRDKNRRTSEMSANFSKKRKSSGKLTREKEKQSKRFKSVEEDDTEDEKPKESKKLSRAPGPKSRTNYENVAASKNEKSRKPTRGKSPEEDENSDTSSIIVTKTQPINAKSRTRDIKSRKSTREKSPEIDEDSDARSTIATRTKHSSNMKNRQSRDNEKSRNESDKSDRTSRKSWDQRGKSRTQASDSSSGKEFKKMIEYRKSYVALKRISEIEQDHTRSPSDSPKGMKDVMSKDEAFALKNTLNNYYDELKKAMKKALNDIERTQKIHCMKPSMRSVDAECMMIETDNIVNNLKQRVESGESRMVDSYDKWCKKTKAKNVLRKRSAEVSSSSKKNQKKESNKPEESGSESSTSLRLASPPRARKASKSRHNSDLQSSEKSPVVSECNSDDIFSGDELRKSVKTKDRASPSIETRGKSPDVEKSLVKGKNGNSNITEDVSKDDEDNDEIPMEQNLPIRSNKSGEESSSDSVVESSPVKRIGRLREKYVLSEDLTRRDSIDPSDADIFEASETEENGPNADGKSKKSDEEKKSPKESSSTKLREKNKESPKSIMEAERPREESLNDKRQTSELSDSELSAADKSGKSPVASHDENEIFSDLEMHLDESLNNNEHVELAETAIDENSTKKHYDTESLSTEKLTSPDKNIEADVDETVESLGSEKENNSVHDAMTRENSEILTDQCDQRDKDDGGVIDAGKIPALNLDPLSDADLENKSDKSVSKSSDIENLQRISSLDTILAEDYNKSGSKSPQSRDSGRLSPLDTIFDDEHSGERSGPISPVINDSERPSSADPPEDENNEKSKNSSPKSPVNKNSARRSSVEISGDENDDKIEKSGSKSPVQDKSKRRSSVETSGDENDDERKKSGSKSPVGKNSARRSSFEASGDENDNKSEKSGSKSHVKKNSKKRSSIDTSENENDENKNERSGLQSHVCSVDFDGDSDDHDEGKGLGSKSAIAKKSKRSSSVEANEDSDEDNIGKKSEVASAVENDEDSDVDGKGKNSGSKSAVTEKSQRSSSAETDEDLDGDNKSKKSGSKSAVAEKSKRSSSIDTDGDSDDGDKVERSASKSPVGNKSGERSLLEITEKRKKSSKRSKSRNSNEDTERGSSVNDDFGNTTNKSSSKSSSNNNSRRASTSSEISEGDNLRMKEALLASSNSDDSSHESSFPSRRTSTRENEETPSTPPTPPESDSNSRKSVKKNLRDRDNMDKVRTRRGKFRIENNRHVMADEKLKQRCEVQLERLKRKLLRRHKRALNKSRHYVESMKLKRLVNLDDLDKDKKVTENSSSENESTSISSKDLKNKKKAQTTKERKETLMDHLERVGNGENMESSDESNLDNPKKAGDDKNEESFLEEANRMAKKHLLESSDSAEEEAVVSESEEKDEGHNKTAPKSKKVVKKAKLDKPSEDEEKKQENEKSRWRKNKILTMKISDSDSEEDERKFNLSQEKLSEKKKNRGSNSESDEEKTAKKKRVRRRVLHSDSDVQISDLSNSDSSDDSNEKKKKKKKNRSSDSEDDENKKEIKKKSRKRIRRGQRSSDSSDSMEEKRPKNRRKRIKTAGTDSDSDDLENSQGTPGKSGRKNIRKVLRDKQVADDTKQAAKDEEERLKRIAERQKLYNEMYENRLAGEEKVEKLVLDFDDETKEPLVSVDENLVKRLKPHQAKGIKFMWDACFESLERTKSTTGSGCILAHCMGLGKSFQIVSLSHTLLQHNETGIKTIMIVCPLSTVLNWVNEFKIWLGDLDDGDDIEVYELTKAKKHYERKYQLESWKKNGGVLIIGYEMFRNLSNIGKKVRKNIQDSFLKCLVDPGPDLVVCDEGHLLKNEDTALSKAMRRVKTLRRIVLTGTPLQNNLIEYHCMVSFVKPNLLGTKKEFMNRFENPITNGQFDDSTEYDVKLMKKRAHVLHKMLEGSVQRLDYSVLTPFLPPKQEYVIFVKLTEIQIKMYQHYLEYYARRHRGAGGSLFADFQALQRIWTHPLVMQMNAEKVVLANEKKRLDATDSEGSLKDFIDDGSDSESSSSSDIRSVNGSDEDNSKKPKRGTRANPVVDEELPAIVEKSEETDEIQWWAQFVREEDYEDMRISSKLLILFRILKESEQIGDKVLVFSQSLYSLTLIEKFLGMIDDETQRGNEPDTLDNHSGSWSLGLDYFRLDGQSTTDNRRRWCDIFNRPTNTRARLFLISTRAGGLGINLTAANRVIIFDASWNPSHDVQSIFRIYRFGQKKPCYVYRLLAAGTMEEKIYNRQVTKLSLSCRVVDEQQIERHYSNNALAELYKLEISEVETTLNLPKDRLLAEIFLKYKHCVDNYHEHDSLLENQAGEELDEEERQLAWLEYEEEKKGKRQLPPMPIVNTYQNEILMQQMNMMNLQQQNALGNIGNSAMMADLENLQTLMTKDYPGVPEAQRKMMASRAIYEMYNYVERQAMANQNIMPMANHNSMPMANHNSIPIMNMAGQQIGYENRVGQPATSSHPNAEMIRMYQQSLAQQQQQQQRQQQQQNGQMNYHMNHGMMGDPLALPRINPIISQNPQSAAQSSASLAVDDDIVEIPLSPEKNLVPSTPAPGGSRKSQEE